MNIKLRNIFIAILPTLIILVVFLFNDLYFINIFIRFALIFATITSSAIILFYSKIPKILYKFLIILSYLCSLGLALYLFLYNYDLLKYFSSITAIKELIISTGALGSLIFIFIQIAQVVFLPIPAVALLVVGIVVYGMWRTAIYCSIGVLIGSYISFLFGKTFGYKFVSWFIGEERVIKYSNILKNNGKYILALVFIFPFFPDDLFCMVAGISPMTFKEFFSITIIIRPISIFVMCFFGGGALFSLNSPVGILILILSLIIIATTLIIIFKKNKTIKSLFLGRNKKRLQKM